MFSGIVEELGHIEKATSSYLQIHGKKVLQNTKIGDSIAVNGVCLTVTKLSENSFFADVAPETFRRSNLGYLNVNSFVNLERSLKVGDPIGGHFVQGHIDTTGTVKSIRKEGNANLVTFHFPTTIEKYIVEKGYVAIDGMSLTIVAPASSHFTVSFIPHTFSVTVAKNYTIGSFVNIEVDILGKYIEKMVTQKHNWMKIFCVNMDFRRHSINNIPLMDIL